MLWFCIFILSKVIVTSLFKTMEKQKLFLSIKTTGKFHILLFSYHLKKVWKLKFMHLDYKRMRINLIV